MVICLGIEAFYYNNSEARQQGVIALVESGYTNKVREVFYSSREMIENASIFEVEKTESGIESRWLTSDEAKPILDDIQDTFQKYDSYASFAWHEFDDGAHDIQPLALTIDNPEPKIMRVQLPFDDSPVKIIDIKYSMGMNWWCDTHPQVEVAYALHELALKHRLVICSH